MNLVWPFMEKFNSHWNSFIVQKDTCKEKYYV